jgi:hypothetical protein
MLLLLTVLFPTLFFVETAAECVTSDFLHKYLHFLLQGLLSGCTLYCSQSIVQFIMSYIYYGHPLFLAHKTTSNYAKFKISVHSIPTTKKHNGTGHNPSKIIPY